MTVFESAVVAVTQDHLDGFAALSGDDNPIHVDPGYAAGTAFRLPVAHGMFLFSLVRAEARRRWPGGRLGRLRLMFPASTPVGTRVRVVLRELGDEAGAVLVGAEVVHADGTLGLVAEGLVQHAEGGR